MGKPLQDVEYRTCRVCKGTGRGAVLLGPGAYVQEPCSRCKGVGKVILLNLRNINLSIHRMRAEPYMALESRPE